MSNYNVDHVDLGRFPFRQPKISGNFGPKQNGTVLSKRKMFGKEGPPFEVDRFFRMDRSDRKLLLHSKNFVFQYRLRVVSNFGDGDCGAGEIHARVRKFEET